MNTLKELTPVQYDECGVRILRESMHRPGAQCFTLHWHDRMELLRVRRGSFQLYLGERRAAEVREGEVAIAAPGQPHMAVAGSDGVEYDVLMFEAGAFCNAAPVTARFLHPLRERRVELLAFSSLLCGAFDQVVSLAQAHPMQAVGWMYQLIAQLMECCVVSVAQPSAADRRFAAVVDYVDEHFADGISTAFLSRRFGYDEAYFCRRFKQLTGLSVLRYVEVLRLERAQRLLSETDIEISRIAEQCGYGDVCYFSHRFHRHFGQSPTDFRRQASSGGNPSSSRKKPRVSAHLP